MVLSGGSVNNGLRPEGQIATGALITYVLIERAITSGRLTPFAFAIVSAAFTLGIQPTGLIAVAALSLFAPWIATYDPQDMDVLARMQPASAEHWFGTDALGRDVVSQLLTGARSPLLVGMGAVGMGLCIGTFMGLLAAQQRGWTESLILKLTDVAFAFPALLTAIMLAATWGPGALSATLAIGLFNIPTFARISRSSAVSTFSPNNRCNPS